MLPAPQASDPPAPAKAAATRGLIVVLVVLVMLYTLAVGWGLLGNMIAINSAYLLMALPCILPIVWYCYGFLRIDETEQDYGLLLSAAGWALIALALLRMHGAQSSAAAAAPPGTAVNADAPLAALICALLGGVGLLSGALLSWNAWRKEIRAGYGVKN